MTTVATHYYDEQGRRTTVYKEVPDQPSQVGVSAGELQTIAQAGGGILQTTGSTYYVKPAPKEEKPEIVEEVKTEETTKPKLAEGKSGYYVEHEAMFVPIFKSTAEKLKYDYAVQQAWILQQQYLKEKPYVSPTDVGASSLTSTYYPEPSKLPSAKHIKAMDIALQPVTLEAEQEKLREAGIEPSPLTNIGFASRELGKGIIMGGLTAVPSAVRLLTGVGSTAIETITKRDLSIPYEKLVAGVTAFSTTIQTYPAYAGGIAIGQTLFWKGIQTVTKPKLSTQVELERLIVKPTDKGFILTSKSKLITQYGSKTYKSYAISRAYSQKDLSFGVTGLLRDKTTQAFLGIARSKDLPSTDLTVSLGVSRFIPSAEVKSYFQLIGSGYLSYKGTAPYVLQQVDIGGRFLHRDIISVDKMPKTIATYGDVVSKTGKAKTFTLTDVSFLPPEDKTFFTMFKGGLGVKKSATDIVTTQLAQATKLIEDTIPKPAGKTIPIVSLPDLRENVEVDVKKQTAIEVVKLDQQTRPATAQLEKTIVTEKQLQFKRLATLQHPIQKEISLQAPATRELTGIRTKTLQQQQQKLEVKQLPKMLEGLEQKQQIRVTPTPIKTPFIPTFHTPTPKSRFIRSFRLRKWRPFKRRFRKSRKSILPTADLFSIQASVGKYGKATFVRSKAGVREFRRRMRRSGVFMRFPTAELIKKSKRRRKM